MRSEGYVPSIAWGVMLVPVFIVLLASWASAQTESVEAGLERSAQSIRTGHLQDAERQLAVVLKASPNNSDALNLLGTIRAQQGNLKGAEVLFRRALRANRQLIGAHMNLAYLYLLERAPENAISELKEAVRLDPNDPQVAYKLARLLLAQGHVDDCMTFIEGVIQSTGERSNAFLVTVLGDAYFKKGNGGMAQEVYFRALNYNSDDIDAVLGLARVAHQRGDSASAGLYLARAREIAADSPDLLYKCGVAGLETGSYDGAKTALELAIKLKPGQASLLIALGAVWLKKTDLFEAERAFRSALEIDPANAQGLMYLGYTLLQQKRLPEAGACLEKSVAADSGNAESFYYLGLVAQGQNNDERAIGSFEKAVQLVPSYSIAHAALGTSYLKLKDYALARAELEMAVKMDPGEPKAHYQLALLYARLKDPARAQNEMSIVEKLKERGVQEGHQSDTPSSSPRSPQ